MSLPSLSSSSAPGAFRALLLGAAFLLVASGHAAAQSALDKAKAAGTLVIANGSNYPPMEFMQNGENVGYDIDFGNELARRMGLKAQWVIVEFKGIIGTLKSGRADAIISGMTITPQRAEQVLFSEPYIDFGIGAAVRAKDTIATPANATGKIVGVEIGTAGASWAREKLTSAKEVKTYESLTLAMKDLDAGRIDLVVNNIPALRYNIKSYPQLKVTPVWDERTAGIAVRQGETALAQEINKALTSMKSDGFMKKIDAKWFSDK